jgi:hypothetical protein
MSWIDEAMKYGLESNLRDLATAIKEREDARMFPSISRPSDLQWIGTSGAHLGEFGDNPTLLLAIKHEVWRQWPDLRSAALKRMDVTIQNLAAQVADQVTKLAVKCVDEDQTT